MGDSFERVIREKWFIIEALNKFLHSQQNCKRTWKFIWKSDVIFNA